jgi:hypothetical protein
VTAPVAALKLVRVPWSGASVMVKVSAWTSGSPSLPVRVIGRAVSSLVERDWALAVGASLTAVTVMLMVAAALVRSSPGTPGVPLSSVTVNWNESGPL